MKFLSGIHNHSIFSDGLSSPEEMVLAAIDRGFVSLGFSEHAWASYDFDCCIKKENIPLYYAEIARLREKYADRIELYTGFESDYYFPAVKDELDFVIGSVHYLFNETTGEYYNVDYKPEVFEAARDRIAGGDIRAMMELYYGLVADMALRYRPDVVGHIDLVTKLNRDSRFFDENSAWYRQLQGKTAEKIRDSGCIVELNTGGVFRGYRDVPYPSPAFLDMFHALSVPVTITSDAHCTDAIDFWFDEAVTLLKDTGYRSVKQLRGGSFVDIEL